MTRSHKPSDSISAGYHTKYLSLSPLISQEMLLSDLVKELEQQWQDAQDNLAQAALTGPMYGVLFCIRSLIADNGIQDQQLVHQLFRICSSIANNVIASVLNCDSPEGFLLESSDQEVSAQILLLCAWRTSKEISLLVGEICHHAPVSLLSQMSQFFTQQLAEIKHRGAFEQAFIGFCSLCSTMWKSHDHGHAPVQLLQDTFDELSNPDRDPDQSSKFCATRRSAGVPFLIQAIVSTEPLKSNFKSLKFALNKLIFELCQDSQSEIRIHAYNILRVLYRESSFGEAVSPFVTEGVKVAILGFKANSWPVSFY